MTTRTPRLSVILSAYLSHTTIRRSLDSLARQTFTGFETIVVDSSPDDRTAAVVRDFPDVVLVRPGRRMSPHEARNAGVERSRAEHLVFTDPDCVAGPEWLACLDESFRSGHRFLGGPIACWPGPVQEEAVFLNKFWKWIPGGPAGHYSDVPSANMGVDRKLYDAVGGVPESSMSGDTEFCLRIQRAAGIRPWFDSRAVTKHITEVEWPKALFERFERGRAYGSMRAGQAGWTLLHTAALVLGWPMLAMRHLAVEFAVCRSRRMLALFFRTWFLVAGLDLAWMAGQALGAATPRRENLTIRAATPVWTPPPESRTGSPGRPDGLGTRPAVAPGSLPETQ